MRLLSAGEVEEMVSVVVRASIGLHQRSLLFMGISEIEAKVPTLGTPRDQVQSDLMHLADTSLAHGGDPPVATYLQNLERLVAPRDEACLVRRLRGHVLIRSAGAQDASHPEPTTPSVAAQFMRISKHMVGDALARHEDGRITVGAGLEQDLAGFADFFNCFLDNEASIIFGPMADLKKNRSFRLQFQESQAPLGGRLGALFGCHRGQLREFGHLTDSELTQTLNRYFFGPILIRHFWTMLGIDSSTWDHRQHAQTFARLFYRLEDE